MAQFLESLVENSPAFLQATWVTLQVTILALIFATIIGLIFAFMKLSSIGILRFIANMYIGIVRGTPLIVQIMWLYFGITQVVVLSAFWAGAIALAVHSGAYIAEIFRGTIQSIEKGQTEAAESLGMTKAMAMRRIILPQAFKRAIPPLGNQFIITLKDSSLVAFIGIMEIFNLSMSQASTTFRQLEFYTIAGVYYLILVTIFTLIVNQVEKRMDTGREK